MQIICDTKEKDPFMFRAFGEIEIVSQSLKTGDYSVPGFENEVAVERKKNTGEISVNIGVDWNRFSAELDRMLLMKYACIVCEFPASYLDTFPVNSGIPKYVWKKLRIKNKFMKSKMLEIQSMGIDIFYTSGRFEAELKTLEILKKYAT